jgi:hypothetical protein
MKHSEYLNIKKKPVIYLGCFFLQKLTIIMSRIITKAAVADPNVIARNFSSFSSKPPLLRASEKKSLSIKVAH